MQTQRLNLMLDSIAKLVRRGALSNAINLLSKLRPVDVAGALVHLPQREREATFDALVKHDLSRAAETLSEMETERAVELLQALNRDDVSRLLQELPSDDAALLVSELPEEWHEELLETMKAEQSSGVQELLGFAGETAGRIMTPDYFALEEDVTAAEAITALQLRSEEFEMVFYLYVIDSRNHLLGVVSLRQLLLSPPSTPLRKIMISDVIKVTTDTDQEEVARVAATYNLLAVPVVDQESKIAGIITVDDIIDVMREEATEDIYALAGVDADDRALGSPMNSVRRRLPSLLMSLGTALIAVAIVRYYLPTIESKLLLAALIPIVAAMGGNAATQTITVVVRAIGLGELSWESSRRVVLKEALVGLTNGVLLGLIAGLITAIFFDPILGGVLSLTMMISLLVAATLGTIVPLTLKRLKLDPALASSVFVLTLTDVVTFFFFLGMATLLLRHFKL
ncbi:MAG: magnesium transporter [Blastocatellia bacterium AA13]|nr:MAG: magnesium transporter [Blastocatellia bacterium AA13]